MADESFKQMWHESDAHRHHGVNTSDASALIVQLTQRNYELSVLVTTLVDLLAEAGQVDPNVLLAKVEGQLEVEVTAKPAAAAGPKVRMIHCARCKAEIPQASATMTIDGLMCDRCG